MRYPYPKSQRLKQGQPNSMTRVYMHYKLGQACVTNWGSFVLLQIRQPLLQNRGAITNWGKIYNTMGQVLQIWAIITNWDITIVTVRLAYIS